MVWSAGMGLLLLVVSNDNNPGLAQIASSRAGISTLTAADQRPAHH